MKILQNHVTVCRAGLFPRQEECYAHCEKILAADARACAGRRTGSLENRLSGADNTSLSIEIGSREALQNGEPITLENPVILYENEPYIPLYEVVERLGGTIDGKTYTLRGVETAVSGVEWHGVLYTPLSYLWDSHIPQVRWDKSRNRVIITEAPDEIPLTRRWLFWRHKTVRGLRVGDSESRFLDLYGSPDARDETMIDLLHVTIENGIVTEISMGHYG